MHYLLYFQNSMVTGVLMTVHTAFLNLEYSFTDLFIQSLVGTFPSQGA